MRLTIRTDITINAPPERIWAILVELERYHEWNPFIRHAKGRIEPDAIFEVSPTTDSGSRHVFHPQVTQYDEGRSFTWTGAFKHRWIALGDHTFRLIPQEGGAVRLEHDETIYGFAAPLLYLVSRKQIEKGFNAMNRALKARAEG